MLLFQDNLKNVIKSEKDVLITGTSIVNLNLRVCPSVPDKDVENSKILLVL